MSNASRTRVILLWLLSFTWSQQNLASPLDTFFADIDAGLRLDIKDDTQRYLLLVYILHKVPIADHDQVRRQILDLRRPLDTLYMPANPLWPGILTPSSQGVRPFKVRSMSLLTCAFRGHWGQDCSTVSRFLRALQPGHRNIAVERANGTAFGQVELVLGTAAGDDMAFLERFQIPRSLKDMELALILLSIYKMLTLTNRSLMIPQAAFHHIGHYSQLGHPVANLPSTDERLSRVLQTYFFLGRTFTHFQIAPDAFISPFYESFAFIAQRSANHVLSEVLPGPQMQAMMEDLQVDVPTLSGRKHHYPALLIEAQSRVGRYADLDCESMMVFRDAG